MTSYIVSLEDQEALLTKPWTVGYRDQGLGHGDHAVMCGDNVIAPHLTERLADHIVKMHNASQGETHKERTTRAADAPGSAGALPPYAAAEKGYATGGSQRSTHRDTAA